MLQLNKRIRRAFLGVAILFLTLTPQCLYASCEGATDTILFGAWLNQSDGTLIKEVGYDYEAESTREFVVEKDSESETFLNAELLRRALGEQFMLVEFKIVDEKPKTRIPLAETLKSLIKDKGLLKRIQDGTDNEHARMYFEGLKTVRELIAEQPGFQALEKLEKCPYRAVRKLRIFGSKYCVSVTTPESEKSLGCLPDFPGDDRSDTTVTPDAVCWGIGNDPKLLSFHWKWECQGEGDLTSTVAALK